MHHNDKQAPDHHTTCSPNVCLLVFGCHTHVPLEFRSPSAYDPLALEKPRGETKQNNDNDTHTQFKTHFACTRRNGAAVSVLKSITCVRLNTSGVGLTLILQGLLNVTTDTICQPLLLRTARGFDLNKKRTIMYIMHVMQNARPPSKQNTTHIHQQKQPALAPKPV